MKTPGQMVKVNDTIMHVYYEASAKKGPPIVFLAGSGTECPLYDFKPLWSLLKESYPIVVMDRPGYGWSGQTAEPRDVDTLVEETREALRESNITGPYIPTAHSMSGLEAIYWGQKYPEEVAAIIGLDMAVPKAYETLEIPKSYSLVAKAAHLLRRPVAALMVKNHPAVKNGGLDQSEQTAMKAVIRQKILSQNMLDEIHYVKDNGKKVAEGECPQLPVLCFLADDPANLKRIPLWGKMHRDYFASNHQAEFVDLSCGHYIHREEPERIAQEMRQFLG
ncbi:alpha/beta fold hydrolase [Enterococcus sp. AZ109]|uniref:alpha/beta fold hydrolase n=1 Tax=Enterococcus sp. AZ109 TaxID=2774634 RepID=UPI003F24856E